MRNQCNLFVSIEHEFTTIANYFPPFVTDCPGIRKKLCGIQWNTHFSHFNIAYIIQAVFMHGMRFQDIYTAANKNLSV